MASRTREPDATGPPLRPSPTTQRSTGEKKLNKVLVKVTIDRSLGAVQIVMSPENTVEALIKAALEIYVKEKRRPFLKENSNPRCYELHYSQFSLECLNPKEKLISLGSRNFFLCSNRTEDVVNSSCSNEVKDVAKMRFAWTRFMDYLL